MLRKSAAKRRNGPWRVAIKAVIISVALAATVTGVEARGGFPSPPGLPAPPNVDIHVSGVVPPPPGIVISAGPARGAGGYRHGDWKHRGRKYGHNKHKRH